LPGNVAICLGPNYEYTLVKTGAVYLVMAKDLVDAAMKDAKVEDYEMVAPSLEATLSI
jgi:isoleucyl-tRNA synthetase